MRPGTRWHGRTTQGALERFGTSVHEYADVYRPHDHQVVDLLAGIRHHQEPRNDRPRSRRPLTASSSRREAP
jgi:hypothetical protein